MAKLHHTTLKAAVAKYSPLVAEGKTADEIKAELSKDEKAFDSEAIEVIYAAIVTPAPGNQGGKKTTVHTVISEFRDKDNFTHVHAVGSDVSHFDKNLLDHLVNIGMVEATEEDDE